MIVDFIRDLDGYEMYIYTCPEVVRFKISDPETESKNISIYLDDNDIDFVIKKLIAYKNGKK